MSSVYSRRRILGASTKLFRILLVGILGVLAGSSAAHAVDLTGKSVKFEGISKRQDSHSTNKDFTYVAEVYFSTKGKAFFFGHYVTQDFRVVIEAGATKGSGRAPNGKYIHFITLERNGDNIHVIDEGRPGDPSFGSEKWIYDVALGGGGCRVSGFRYLPDPNQRLLSAQSLPGNCTIMDGPGQGLVDK